MVELSMFQYVCVVEAFGSRCARLVHNYDAGPSVALAHICLSVLASSYVCVCLSVLVSSYVCVCLSVLVSSYMCVCLSVLVSSYTCVCLSVSIIGISGEFLICALLDYNSV